MMENIFNLENLKINNLLGIKEYYLKKYLVIMLQL